MEIKLEGKAIEEVIKHYAFDTFGKLFGVDKKEDLLVEIDCNYSNIQKVTITKKEPEKTESEE